jgi:hypothetical protein
MLQKKRYLFFLILLSAYFLFTLIWLSRSSQEFKFADQVNMSECPTLAAKVLKIPIHKDSLLERFPYGEYLCEGQFKPVNQLKEDIDLIGIKYPNLPFAGQYVVATALTEKLYDINRHTFIQYQPDTLLAFLEYAERVKISGNFDTANAAAYDVIYQFWFEKVAQLMSSFQARNNDLRQDFTFRFIDTKLGRNRFLTNIRESRIEKFIHNVKSGNWAHVASATWNDLSLLWKGVLAGGILLTFYAYFYLFIGLLKTLKK